MSPEEPEAHLGLVLSSLKRNADGAGSTEVIASALPEQIDTARVRDVLEKAEDRGLVCEVAADWWKLTESGWVIAEGGWPFPSGYS